MSTGSLRAIIVAMVSVFLTACGTSAPVTKTYSDNSSSGPYGNFLVIAVAGDYTARAQFERTVVSGLKSEGALAKAYYSVVPGNAPISREAVIAAVESGRFDAVLITRILDQQLDVDIKSGSTETKASTIGGSALNFFRYDYEELNEPKIIDFNRTIVLGTELFSTEDDNRVWSIKSSSKGTDIGGLIDSTAAAIVRRLRRDGLIDR